MFSYPLQLHAVEPSELALNPKGSCVSAAQVMAHVLLSVIQTELNSKFYSNFSGTSLNLLSILHLYCGSLEDKTLS